MKWVPNLLRNKAISAVDMDGAERLNVHGKIFAEKKMLREVFVEFHHAFRRLDERWLSGSGMRIELGAGIAPVRDTFPDVLATDVVPSLHLDRTLNAEDMDLPDNSVRAMYGQNCFHHFPHPELFFQEITRVLAPGGGVILLEPYYGPFATFLFKRLFTSEGFDKQFPAWETPATGPMNGANQALSYIVFMRDRKRFETAFPQLKIVHHELCSNHYKYLVSGGLNFRQLLPDSTIKFVDLLQRVMSPLNMMTSLHHIIVLRKEG